MGDDQEPEEETRVDASDRDLGVNACTRAHARVPYGPTGDAMVRRMIRMIRARQAVVDEEEGSDP